MALKKKDKEKIYKLIRRNTEKELGIDRLTRTKVHKNKKKYSRKKKHKNF